VPNYVYKCERCKAKYSLKLPMSHDAKILYNCEDSRCIGLCRRIIAPGATFGMPKVRAGDWFKKTYGKELGEK